ncbi:MAG: ABC transporter permease, partial [Acidobacteriota bacterium]|nr:ABC transporter permease [Acidobacteriota bacterium]
MMLRESLRFFRRYRMLSLSAVITLAIGLSASCLSLEILLSLADQGTNGLRPGSFVTIAESSRTGPLRPISWDVIRQLSSDLNLTESGAYGVIISASLELDGRQKVIRVAAVSPDFFGRIAYADLGGGLSSGRDPNSGQNVVVLNPHLASDLFGSPLAALDRVVAINGVSLRIAGISPKRFAGLFGQSADAWIPANCVTPIYLQSSDSAKMQAGGDVWRKVPVFYAIARFPESNSEITAKKLTQVLRSEHRFESRLVASNGLTLDPIREQTMRGLASMALFLAFCLTMASGLSFGGLLLARVPRQVDEVRLRRTLGASGGRLLLELAAGPMSAVAVGFSASLLLSLVAVIIMKRDATWLGLSVMILWRHMLLASISQLPLIGALAVAMALVPAARLLRDAGTPQLSRAITPTRRSRMVLRSIVSAQMTCGISACVVGATVAGSTARIVGEPVGFRSEHRTVLAVNIKPGLNKFRFSSDSRGTFPMAKAATQILMRLSSLQEVSNAAMALSAPLEPAARSLMLHRFDSSAEDRNVAYNAVTPSYFALLGARLLAGRGFASSDIT